MGCVTTRAQHVQFRCGGRLVGGGCILLRAWSCEAVNTINYWVQEPLIRLPIPHRKSSLRSLKIWAQLGRDPVRPNSKHIITEVRVWRVKNDGELHARPKSFATCVECIKTLGFFLFFNGTYS
jgi:hypothetical protein